jgi:AraC family transcriptional regulator
MRSIFLTETAHHPHLRLPPHEHESANIVFVIGGSFLESSKRNTFDCNGGSFLLKPAGAKHSNHYSRTGARCLIAEFRQQFLDLIPTPEKLFPEIRSFTADETCALPFRVYREFQTGDSSSALTIQELILDFLHGLSADSRSVNPRPWVSRAKDYIDAEFPRPLTLQELAKVAGDYHPTHLARSFRNHFGLTIGEYVRFRRLQFAVQDLQSGDKSLCQIAIEAGFYDQSHFIRHFKRVMGVSPTCYRATTA